MYNIDKSLDYVVIATFFESDSLNIKIGYKEQKTVENFYILNEFPFNDENIEKFKMLFDIFFSDKKPKEFLDFFVSKDKFYAIFKYVETENIKNRYRKGFTNSSFGERCITLEKILVYIDKVYNFNRGILGCITESENIRIDEDKNLYFTYNLRNIDKYNDENTSLKLILKNIRDIMYILLEPEAKAKFNKALHIVLDKCERGVYSSIPELVIDLKKAEEICKTSSWFSYFKYQIYLRKDFLKKLSKVSIISLILLGAGYYVYSEVTKGQQPGSAPMAVTIGGISYNGNKDDDTDKNVSAENIDSQVGTSETGDIILSEGLDMEYEDYIVQYGDTVKSICNSYYKDLRYVTAISTFNGIDKDDKLTAGTIIKLPNKTAIALYISK